LLFQFEELHGQIQIHEAKGHILSLSHIVRDPDGASREGKILSRKVPGFVQSDLPDHGRVETRKIWTTTELNAYLDFPNVGQTFMVQRETINKKSGEYPCEIAYGITSRTPHQADPKRVLTTNPGHWSIENSCHYIIDWNYDEDRSRIRIGYGPENITRLR